MELVKKTLPNSTATLVLGITSIVSCWAYGVIGIVLAIVALAISAKPLALYKQNPSEYEGYGNLNAGRIMAIIGLSLSGLFVLILIIIFSLFGTIALSLASLLSNL